MNRHQIYKRYKLVNIIYYMMQDKALVKGEQLNLLMLFFLKHVIMFKVNYYQQL